MTLLTILGILLVALAVTIPLLERFSPRLSPQTQQRMSRWILPLVALGLVMALLRQCTTGG